ncbi:hypothetical protein CDD81_3556 [Ophiocordyceps australis]|uniref:P-type Na(+) transporter n=1 Tax=Ophiocordyceps australis TaxID=1399860 RepID=A0A2C5XW88_9HYPO|nr:hypothetical protein CDD81_3556 [Ophiocordyceps australis]
MSIKTTPPIPQDSPPGPRLTTPSHAQSTTTVLAQLDTSPHGLDAQQASQRLARLGPNQLTEKQGVRPFALLLEQIFNAMTLVLILALAASLGIRAWIEGGILAAIILLNIVIGFLQSYQAEKTIDALKTLASPTCRVVRAGKLAVVDTASVVLGDIVDLTVGDSVPADLRLIDTLGLEADEALLTGESMPVAKDARPVLPADTGPGDRINIALSSTTITKGRGRGVVVATAMDTEIGLIARALNQDGAQQQDADSSGPGKPARVPKKKSLGQLVRGHISKFLGLSTGTPLERKLAQLFLGLFVFALLFAVIVLAANHFDTRKDVILYAVTTSVGTIPVSLLLVLTVTMAAGTKVMVRRHVIVRNLQSLEALGGVTNICSDKTGTITQGRMSLRVAHLPGAGTYYVDGGQDVFNPTAGRLAWSKESPGDKDHHHVEETSATVEPAEALQNNASLSSLLNIATLANLATLEPPAETASGTPKPEETQASWKASGAPTEIALEVFTARFGWSRTQMTQGSRPEWTRMAEFPFDSDVKMMTVVFRQEATGVAHVFTKGAVERVLSRCTSITTQTSLQPLDQGSKAALLNTMDHMASQGLRVLALADKTIPPTHKLAQPQASISQDCRSQLETDLVLRGLVGIHDPPRPESAESIRRCRQAGIVVHMLTGDYAQTARAIASEVGILPSPHHLRLMAADAAASLVMTAQQLNALDDEQIDALPELPLVVARCAPSTKVRMIQALHRRGRYVAMTGDGVNDSPSLKRADIGISMGSGSDVAKQSSDIILTDDNFASILNAIEEGRRIFDNIQKFILHVLAANIGFVVALLAGLAFKDGSGTSVFLLTPVEILWMLMATGAFCETGLGFEAAVPDILQRPPHNLRYGVFSPEFFCDMVVYGVIMSICTLGSFTFVIFQIGNGNLGFECNERYSPACNNVFRARATCYTTMTWILLLFSWELIDSRRSFFYMPHGFRAWAKHLWSNRFLFFSVTIVFFIVFPTLYIPKLNHVVFKHTGFSQEWGVVFVAVFFFILSTEGWKWSKRIYARRHTPQTSMAWAETA